MPEYPDYNSPLDEINGILEKQKQHQINPELTSKLNKNSTISSEKMLLNYTSDNPRIFHTTVKDIFNAHVAVETKLTDGFTKAIPIILIFGGVMVVALIMGNMPTIIDSIAKNFGVEKRIITETQIVYLTEEEAREKGITIPTQTSPSVQTPVVTEPEITPTQVPESRCPAGTIAIDGECKKEGFDIVGNLAPKIISPNLGTNTKSQQPLCDPGSTRSWNTTVARWYCIDQFGVATQQKVGYTD